MELDAIAATVGELTCGCPFVRDGLYPTGTWMQCPFHALPAPMAHRSTATKTGVIGA